MHLRLMNESRDHFGWTRDGGVDLGKIKTSGSYDGNIDLFVGSSAVDMEPIPAQAAAD